MSTGRDDAFELALAALRARLRDGDFPPGGRIPASALASSLKLSATPVREALSRLAGEGLVEERRNQGFFVRTLSGVDVADLYRLALAHLLIIAGRDRERRPPTAPDTSPATDPVRAIEGFFQAWVTQAGSRALGQMHQTIATQLGPVRRIEPQVFEDLAFEADALLHSAATGDGPELAQGLRRFHGRRIQAAEKLSAALNMHRKI